ncbi:hypothetical protein [Tenuibacillus multivorans]|uniref:Uncharacterized protein n=1 Tax=Tenuibacillus multivorans TaxID=237069 RepID=A0A1H0EGP9_9BACI|nr:hypothetical protein [Tenuibacillus multivorans]GEL77169.1 hypothetical protein TMU01_14040 [Tenuibacillus multivorans]SDN81446.1 hypothetical protein SAMN05216498_3141 [Tenuibacillus multivorans]
MTYLYFLYITVGVILGTLIFGPLGFILGGFIGFLGGASQSNRKKVDELNRNKIEELEIEINKLKNENRSRF